MDPIPVVKSAGDTSVSEPNAGSHPVVSIENDGVNENKQDPRSGGEWT